MQNREELESKLKDLRSQIQTIEVELIKLDSKEMSDIIGKCFKYDYYNSEWDEHTITVYKVLEVVDVDYVMVDEFYIDVARVDTRRNVRFNANYILQYEEIPLSEFDKIKEICEDMESLYNEYAEAFCNKKKLLTGGNK